MRTSWFALHTSFMRALNRASAEAAFATMRLCHPELAAFSTIAALMEHQQSLAADPTARYQMIRTLVAAAQSGEFFQPTAQGMVIIVLWPGLDAVFWRLARGFPSARHDLAAEILARFCVAIRTLDLETVTAVTATLLRNLERDIRRDLIRDRARTAANRPIDDPAIVVLAEEAATVVGGEACGLSDYFIGISREDTLLLKRVFLLGETQEEAGLALSLRPDAARKRVQRAVRKIRSQHKFPESLSQCTSQDGL